MDAFGDEQEPAAREHIIETATRLFAALGYDATPVEVIAEATGLDVATITALVGDKPSLYATVMDRVHAAQRAMYNAAIAGFTPDREGMHRLTDRILEYNVEHPEVSALWIHRWQSDASDITELESAYALPTLARFRALVQRHRLAPAEMDVDLALMSIIWNIRGFCTGGVVNSKGEREGPDNPVFLEQFKRHLHQLADQMFTLDR